MRQRLLLLTFMVAAVFGYAWFTPPEVPQKPKSPRWIKIDGNGKELDAWKVPWKCVLDRQTGLVWEVKSYAEDIHDKQCSFSWFDGKKGAKKKGDCFIEGQSSDTYDLIQLSNEEKRCGITNWRLPTEAELRTLLIETPLPGDVHIARDYFPYTQRGPYWSADAGKPLLGHYKYLKEGAVSVHFITGQRRTMPYRDATFVRLVASPNSKEQTYSLKK